MTAAMEEALGRLRLREQAMTARAEASERLSGEIIASLTSGLLVVGDDRRVKSLNPAGRRLLGHAGGGLERRPQRRAARRAAPLAARHRGVPRHRAAGAPPHGPHRRRATIARRISASRCRRSATRARHAARRDLPLQRSDRHRRARGAAAAEGQPGAGRRADRGHRARVPQRPGDDPRLRAAARSRSAAAGHASLRASASATRPTRSAPSCATS